MKQKNIDYINVKGLDVIRQHAQDFIAKREAPAFIPNDGKQTLTQGCTMSSGHRLCTEAERRPSGIYSTTCNSNLLSGVYQKMA